MLKLVFVHMLNNFSGSPNVLSVVVRGFVDKGYSVKLITGKGIGFLSDIDGVKYQYTVYRWIGGSKLETLIRFVLSQIQLFFIILFTSKKDTTFYINTVMPFGASIACKLSNRKVIYHCHENMMQSKPFYTVYRNIYKWVNTKSVFVSNYVASQAYGCKNGKIIYNGLLQKFYESAALYSGTAEKRTVLMICSLRRYKGIYEFIDIARCIPELDFELVVSDDQYAVDQFYIETSPPSNICFFSKQSNVHPFYARAKILLSLSHPSVCIETFGLTILEAMTYGIPAIVPNVGGPVELVENGINGYIVDPLDISDVVSKIRKLNNIDCYNSFSREAKKRASEFSMYKMVNSIEEYIKE